MGISKNFLLFESGGSIAALLQTACDAVESLFSDEIIYKCLPEIDLLQKFLFGCKMD